MAEPRLQPGNTLRRVSNPSGVADAILNRPSWMALALFLDVPNHIGELFWSYGRSRVFRCPTQSEDIPRETARGIATPTLEVLNQSWQVDAGDGAEQHVDVRAENGKRNDVSALPCSRSTKVLLQELARGTIDHRTAIAGSPREVDVELMSGHAEAGNHRVIRCCSHPVSMSPAQRGPEGQSLPRIRFARCASAQCWPSPRFSVGYASASPSTDHQPDRAR